MNEHLPSLGNTLGNLVVLVKDNFEIGQQDETKSEFLSELSSNLDETLESLQILIEKVSEIRIAVNKDYEENRSSHEEQINILNQLTYLHLEVISPNLQAIKLLIKLFDSNKEEFSEKDLKMAVTFLNQGSENLVLFINKLKQI